MILTDVLSQQINSRANSRLSIPMGIANHKIYLFTKFIQITRAKEDIESVHRLKHVEACFLYIYLITDFWSTTNTNTSVSTTVIVEVVGKHRFKFFIYDSFTYR